jgi:hypothetical protein
LVKWQGWHWLANTYLRKSISAQQMNNNHHHNNNNSNNSRIDDKLLLLVYSTALCIRNKSTSTSNTKALEFQEQSQAPPPFPKTKHAWAHPLVSSCNHLLLQVLLQQVIQEKKISKKNILKSSIQLLILILPKYFPREFAKGTWSSGKWQVVPTREFTYPKFSQMFPIFFRKHLLSDFWGMLKTLLI